MLGKYKACELHTHTWHSDGRFTVGELCEKAVQCQYDAIAMTDHNTMAGHAELTPELAARTLPVVRGIEWTTFYGHLLVLNASGFVDWRDAGLDNIDMCIERLGQTGAVAGIAHPFCVGDPFCTGCHWDFPVRDWHGVRFMEVWSKTFPCTQSINRLAFDLWTELLNRGFKIAATYGRDWHADGPEPVHTACTYLGAEGEMTGSAMADALRGGRSYVTAGPGIEMVVSQGGKDYGIGDTIMAGEADLRVSVDETERVRQWEAYCIHVQTIRIVQNSQTLCQASGPECDLALRVARGWLRVEIYGSYMGNTEDVLLGFTSPVYVE